VTPKKRRGRPATGRDPHVTSRMPAALIVEVEAWASANDTSRSEAFRRLVELGLKATPKARPIERALAHAAELAAKASDKIREIPASPSEEYAQRRRKHTKGPGEFREGRVDRPKAKKV